MGLKITIKNTKILKIKIQKKPQLLELKLLFLKQ